MTDAEMVYNERSKLAATFWNTLAASCVTVGVLTNLATSLVIWPDGMSDERLYIGWCVMVVSGGLAGYLHRVAKRYLGGLKS